ncbi:MAG: AAA family ATPase [Defluviitaleaceae bacterium]|nr:AAA family ATPase [Defluviitaleaceae bacterium]
MNLMLVGMPGIGKTAIVENIFGDGLVKILVSTMLEEDVGGLPYREGATERRTQPKFLRELEEKARNNQKACLFLDELDKARQEVADTLLTLIQSRKINEWGLPDNCQIVAAANPPEFGGGNGISEPMQSRFSIINWLPDPVKWANWCLEKYPHAADIADAVRNGQIPIYDRVGQGLDTRTTCPRTLEMAILAEDCPLASRVDKIKGLLTPQAASFFVEQSAAEKQARQIISQQRLGQVLRL